VTAMERAVIVGAIGIAGFAAGGPPESRRISSL